MSRKPKVLFVCGGNTCRSPMAAGVATTLMGGRAEVSSAGVEAWGQRASRKAIASILRRYQVDLSTHRSTDVEHVNLGHYDFIVSMEPRFAKRLADEFNVPMERVIVWNVKDPAIENTEAAYESCLSDIEKLLPQVLDVMLPKRQS
jgi:protein-tyrosine-phosphatase